MKRLLLVAVLLCWCILPARAGETETMAAERAHQLTGSLRGEAAALMEGVQNPTSTAGFGELLQSAAAGGQDAWCAALRSLSKMLLVAVLCGMVQGLRSAAGGSDLPVVTMAGALGMTGVLVSDLTGMMGLCRDTLEQVSVFSKCMLPVMAAAVTMTGAPTAATVLQTITMFSFDLLVRLINGVLLPGVGAYIAIITLNAAIGNDLLGQLASFVKWLTTGCLKLSLTVFIAYLTISGVIGGSADALAVKTAKFAVSGSVPVVGGIISDAAESMLAGAVLIRNTVGVVGMLCILAICILPFLQVGCNYLLFKAGGAVLSPVCGGTLARLVSGLSDSMGLMLGMLGTCTAILFFELVFSITLVSPL